MSLIQPSQPTEPQWHYRGSDGGRIMSTLWVRIKALFSGSGQHEVVHEITIEQQDVAQEAKTEQQAAAQEAKSESHDVAQKTEKGRKAGALKGIWAWRHSSECSSDRVFRYFEGLLKAAFAVTCAIFAWIFTANIANELYYWTAWGAGIIGSIVSLAIIVILAILVAKDMELE